MIIEDVKKTAYVTEDILNWYNKFNKNEMVRLNKTRCNDIDKVHTKKYKLVNAKKVTIEESDKALMKKALVDHTIFLDGFIEKVFMPTLNLTKKGKKPTDYGYLQESGSNQEVCCLYAKGFAPKTYDYSTGKYTWEKDSYSFYVYDMSDKEELPPTPKELEALDALDKRKKMTSLNRLVMKDSILDRLNEKGYEIYFDDGSNIFGYGKIKGWNALVKDALEYYLNNEVLKPINCKITIPKSKSQHHYGYYDILTHIGDIEMVFKKTRKPKQGV